MTEKLDRYAPDPSVIAGVKSQLLSAGVPADAIPVEWLPGILAATAKWIQTTEDGLAYASRLLHFELRRGDDDKKYEIIDDHERRSYTVNSHDVWFYCGSIVDKRPIPQSMLYVSEKDRSQCEDCGIVSHCLKSVLDPYKDKLKELCNYCIIYNGHPRVTDQGDERKCRECTVRHCQHHPHLNEAM